MSYCSVHCLESFLLHPMVIDFMVFVQSMANFSGGTGGVLCLGVSIRTSLQKGLNRISFDFGFDSRWLLWHRHCPNILCGLLGQINLSPCRWSQEDCSPVTPFSSVFKILASPSFCIKSLTTSLLSKMTKFLINKNSKHISGMVSAIYLSPIPRLEEDRRKRHGDLER